MACRKDGKGRVLRKGEGYRKSEGRYSYVFIDPLGKKRTIYAKSLVKLREREEQLLGFCHGYGPVIWNRIFNNHAKVQKSVRIIK